jgi:hypothetical protein
MSSELHIPQWSSRSGPKGEDLTTIEQWFIRQGVPQFAYGYWAGRDSMPILSYLLLIVVAFDLAIQPWISLNPLFLLIAPAALVLVGLVFGFLIKATIIDQASDLIRELKKVWKVNEKNPYLSLKEQLSYLIANRVRVATLLAGVFFVSYLLLRLGRDVYWTDFTVDFTVIAVLLWSSGRLFRHDVWSEDDAKLRERRRLYAIVAVAVIGFALEGSILPDATSLMDGFIGSIMPAAVAAVPVPQASAALLVTLVIVVQSQALIPKPRGTEEVQRQRPIPAPSEAVGVTDQQRFNVFFPAVPLLVLVCCAETAILPHAGPVWVAAAGPLTAMVGLAALHPLRRRRQDKPTPTRTIRRPQWPMTPKWLHTIASHQSVHRFITYPGVTSLVVLYLVACPLLVGILATSHEDQPAPGIFTNPANARSAILLTLTVNLFYLSLVVGIAVFALHQVAGWAIKEALKDLRERIANLGRGLSILVVFAALALLTAETWEAMRRISTQNYTLILAAILVLAGAFHLITSIQHVNKTAAFSTWSEVHASAMPKDDNPPDPAIKDLLEHDELRDLNPEDPNSKAPKYPLGFLETANTVIVMMTYEIFFFLPVTVVAAIVFLTFGYLTVPDTVAANWIYGDRAEPDKVKELIQLPLMQQPWLRVGLLLTVFSILYLVVDILSDPDKRSSYFQSADKAVRRRLAVRLAYCEVRAHRNLPQQGHHPTHFRWIPMPIVAAPRTDGWQPPTTSPTRESKTPNGRSSRFGPTTDQTADSPDQPATP